MNGNSGGPLVAVEEGKIIGINTCIRANMERTSFAVPINKVKGIMYDLANGKHINHGYVGKYCSAYFLLFDTYIFGSLLNCTHAPLTRSTMVPANPRSGYSTGL